MRLQRELSAAVAIPAVLAILWFAPPQAFGALVAVLGLGTLAEFYRLAEKSGIPVPKWLALAIAAAILAATVVPAPSPSGLTVAGGIFGSAAIFATALMLSGIPLAQALSGTAVATLGLPLVVFPCCALIWLDRVNLAGASGRFGPRLILFLLVTIWGCDSFAYYVGRNFGRHKLAPAVSPKKTIEGSIGGFAGSILIAVGAAALFIPEFRLPEAAIIGGLASTAGQIGDLVESMFKRGAGVKDSGVFLPGHGGFYDRVDSLLFAAPVLCGAVLVKMAVAS
ncbi:MAG TPA: phosphatidate cytidylyltransferase [Thermoanaerobaculia bacterium]|nr:phosphatidate cytidylyltransferase [Thermoanaerobaculia bacterium]